MSVRIAKPSAFTPARMRSPSFNPGPRYAPTLVRLALSNEALKTNAPTASRMPRAMRWTCSSLSMTHGPAIRTSGPRKALNSKGTRVLWLQFFFGGQALPAVFLRRPDECPEQRVRFHRLGFELGVELAAQIPGMPGDLADLHVRVVRRFAGDPQTRGLQPVFVLAVEFVAMAMPLIDLARPIGGVGETVLGQPAGPASQAHGAAQIVHALQLAQLENHAVRRARVELGGIGVLEAAHVARVLDDHGLHAQADAEIRHLVFAGEADGVQHAVDSALAESARHQHAIEPRQL